MKHLKSELQQQLLSRWSEALGTPAFRTRGIDLESLIKTLEPAAQRCFQRLIQALFREGLLNPDICEYDEFDRCWLALDHHSRLCFEQLSSGRMSSWNLQGRVTLHGADGTTQVIGVPSQLLNLLAPCLDASVSPQTLARLGEEFDDSFYNDTLCLAFHERWSHQLSASCAGNWLAWLRDRNGESNPTLLLEQWGTLGHPWHPGYKTKLGLSPSQVIAMAPEFEARLAVRLCALHRSCCHVESMPGVQAYWAWWQTHFPLPTEQLRQRLRQHDLPPEDYQPLPCHPWQAEEVLPKKFANEIADRLLIITEITAFQGHPTMSFRTLVPHGCPHAPMVKLPVAMRLTSVQRTVSPRSACMGPRVSQLLLQILEREPALRALLDIVPERIGVHYLSHPANDDLSRHLTALYRDSLQSRLQSGELAIPVGSLFAGDENARPLLRQWVRLDQGDDDRSAMRAFFRSYLSIAVPGLLGIYLLYGVAFEAHQQNSFMLMSPDGHPSRLLLRDFGDIRIHRQSLQAHGLDLSLYDPGMTLFDDSDFVRDKLLHATFMCHLGELLLLCARNWNVPEEQLWDDFAREVAECFEHLRHQIEPARWEAERQALLEQDWPAKSFLRMRLLDSPVDIVGRLPNPLRIPAHGR